MRKHFSKIGFMYLIGTIIVYAVQLLSLTIVGKLNETILENYTLQFLCTMIPMYVIAMPIMAKLICSIPVENEPQKRKMSVGHWFVAFFICYAGIYICNFIGLFITNIIGIIKQDSVGNVMQQITMEIHPLANLIIVAICAPIIEEFIFRKLLIDRLAKYGEGIAVVLSGFMFGLYHGNLNQFVYAFFIGVFWGFIYVKTRNIIYTIIMHMVVNFMGSFLGGLLLKYSGYQKMLEGVLPTEFTVGEMIGMLALVIYGMCIIVFVIVGVVLFIINRKKFTLNPGEVTIERGQRFKTVILNWGMGLFSLFWIAQIIRQLLA